MSEKKQKTPPATKPTLDQWKKLYALAVKIKELAPWNWMEEDDIFGFKMPDTGSLGFVSVMGTLGEHYSIAVYQGIKGLGGFWRMQELGPKLTPEIVLQVPQLQASFEDRDIITDEDRAVMKSLGLKFRGRQAWPQFRSYRPAFMPWYLEREEANMLICGLEQTLDVALRFKEEPDILLPTDSDYDYLLRVNENNIWKDSQMRVDFRYKQTLNLEMNFQALEELKAMAPSNAAVEVDLSMLPEPVQGSRKERPFFPYMLMMAEHDSGFILSVELLEPMPTLEAMWEQVPAMIVEGLANAFTPKEIQVRDEFLKNLLGPLGKALGINIKKVTRLTSINRAKRELNRFIPGF